MSQSQVMVGALIAGFVIWLLMNNGLAKYWALLTGGGAVPPSGTATTPQAPSTNQGSATGGITINPGPTSAGSPSFFGTPQTTTPGG